MGKQIVRRKWSWIGHTMRKDNTSIARQAQTWNPQGKRKRGQPRNIRTMDTEREMRELGLPCTDISRVVESRVRWQSVLDGLCSAGS